MFCKVRMSGILFMLCLHCFSNELKCFGVDFDCSMQQTKQYRRDLRTAKRIKKLYDKFIVHCPDYAQEPRIPKIIHQIWLGSPLPEKYYALQESWKKHHPDWLYILWDDAALEALDMINKDVYYAATNYGTRSDIARIEILYHFGGLYIDTDFECIKAFDVFHHSCDFYASLDYTGITLFNGLIGARPEHPVLARCLDELADIDPRAVGDNIQSNTGPYFFTRCFLASLDRSAGRCVAFPVTYFVPFPNTERGRSETIEQWLRPESYAIHHWHVAWFNANVKK